MATLIHLNGPSGVGKSTLAQCYADANRGVLNLDIDRVAGMIGGWQDDFSVVLAPARRLAIAMAATHLRSGFDVVMPQLVTSVDEAARFEEAARGAGAAYLEIALVIDPEEQITRFRAKASHSPVDEHIHQYIDARGGDAILQRINRHFSEYLEHRPLARRLDSRGQAAEATYAAVLSIVG